MAELESGVAPAGEPDRSNTRWLSSWIVVLALLGLAGASGGLRSLAGGLSGSAAIFVTGLHLVGAAYCWSVAWGLNSRKLWAWRANWVAIYLPLAVLGALAVAVIAVNVVPSSSRAGSSAVSDVGPIGGTALWALIWGPANHRYFIRRRTLFS